MKMGNTVTFSVSGMQLGTQTAVFHQEMRRMVLYGGEWLDVPEVWSRSVNTSV